MNGFPEARVNMRIGMVVYWTACLSMSRSTALVSAHPWYADAWPASASSGPPYLAS